MLSAPAFEKWTRKTGKSILDGIGSTEMLHIFITNRVDDMAPGATGKPLTGYQARVVERGATWFGRSTGGARTGRLPVAGGCATARLCPRRLESDRRFVRAGHGRRVPFRRAFG
jgi:2-aminobenzoate-CoA ligase